MGVGTDMMDMGSSGTMPRVESTSGRLAVAADLIQRAERWAAELGLSREEAAELALRGIVAPTEPAAAELLNAYRDGAVQRPEEISAALASAEVDVPVVGVRLGPRRPVDGDEPFTRDAQGADLDATPESAWHSARGLWRMSDRPRILVALRFGLPLGIYRVPSWEQDPVTGRRWAATGQILTSGQRFDANTGQPVGDATDSDRLLLRVIKAKPLIMPPGAANPVVWLHGR